MSINGWVKMTRILWGRIPLVSYSATLPCRMCLSNSRTIHPPTVEADLLLSFLKKFQRNMQNTDDSNLPSYRVWVWNYRIGNTCCNIKYLIVRIVCLSLSSTWWLQYVWSKELKKVTLSENQPTWHKLVFFYSAFLILQCPLIYMFWFPTFFYFTL